VYMDKYSALQNIIRQYSSAVVAFSGGVDSTLLAKVTGETLPGATLLITATSATYPFAELEEAKELAGMLSLPHRVIVSEEVDIPGFSTNPPDRCYYCKSELFTQINHIAREMKYEAVFDGSNADDLHDYRPGRRALKELGIHSPLCEAGMTKQDVRALSSRLGLPTADKPAYACLASRFPYGEEITREKLTRVGTAEAAIRAMGFTQFRVRSHDTCARIECIEQEADRAWAMRREITAACKTAGFVYVAIDTVGYRTGAMNESLTEDERS
jgi:uncharacterized protein